MSEQPFRGDEEIPSLQEFLTSLPPGTETIVKLHALVSQSFSPRLQILLPELQMHCKAPACKGNRFFEPKGSSLYADAKKEELHFLTFVCKNCEKTTKTYAISLGLIGTDKAKVVKIGEWPTYGTPTPTRLLSLVENEKDYFLKGRRSENQGLGIGAFAYYRRVVENQKDRIFDEIIRAAQTTKSDPDLVAALRHARDEGQFSRAVESLKGAIPQSLLIEGHNPLTLLHNALSDGLHAQTDDECLELAHTIRVVLAALAERIGELLKDESELKQAISKLMTRRSTP